MTKNTRARLTRAGLVVLLTAALVTPTTAASAAGDRPGQVGLITFTGASMSSLTVDWPDVDGAERYEVFTHTNYNTLPSVTKPAAVVEGSKATVTGLRKGTDYFVQVRAVNSADNGPRSQRVGHATIAGQTSAGKTKPYSIVTWNICSNACANIAGRKGIIDARIRELAPGVVGLQEASKYKKAPAGYAFVVNGQNDILVRKGEFSKVAKKKKTPTTGSKKFARKYGTPGHGVTWAALKHRSGQHLIVFNVHMPTGTSASQTKQRQYEATQLTKYMSSTVSKLRKKYGAKIKSAGIIVLGDFNTSKGRAGDSTRATMKAKGWYDAFDQARTLTGQHFNSANPGWSAAPVVGVTWGEHIDHVFVKPSKTIVYSWANAGKMSGGKFVTPLGSDHHPVLVTGIFR